MISDKQVIVNNHYLAISLFISRFPFKDFWFLIIMYIVQKIGFMALEYLLTGTEIVGFLYSSALIDLEN